MATVTGQATDPVSPGVLGQALTVDVPNTWGLE